MQMECKNPATIAADLANSVCVKKVKSSVFNLTVLGILAGVFIGFGAWLATVVGHDMGANLGLGMTKFMMGAVFSVGLMLVVIAGAELFTGNNLIVLSVLEKKASFGGLMRNWSIVYVANLVGSVLLALIIFYGGLWKMGGNAVGNFAMGIANGKVDLAFWPALFRAIGCNWLVCLAVWMALSSRDTVGKVFAIFFPIMAFVASGFEHSIANMFFIPMGLLLKTVGLAGVDASSNLNMYGFLVRNEIPVTLGNIVGGAFFVATLYWSVYIRKQKEIA
ncbi:MAG TPA: formate/nitrite transporter family protein [Candidatus Aminicenantes bacterium]|nr:formate/nitrite transporter family protein [Candidatus Aminicenantes bacterium]